MNSNGECIKISMALKWMDYRISREAKRKAIDGRDGKA